MKRIVRLRVDPEKSALDITPTYDCPFYYSVLMAITEVKKNNTPLYLLTMLLTENFRQIKEFCEKMPF